ncbi:XRE family transcriptional regulator, partial [Vibrio anguillarum]|nr:XRE family transcriptional regulator [Vibrio anguillarum]
MIRGKAFEFSAKEALQQVLDSQQYDVSNPKMNAQTGSHDIDVKIADTLNNIDFSIE